MYTQPEYAWPGHQPAIQVNLSIHVTAEPSEPIKNKTAGQFTAERSTTCTDLHKPVQAMFRCAPDSVNNFKVSFGISAQHWCFSPTLPVIAKRSLKVRLALGLGIGMHFLIFIYLFIKSVE